MPPEAQDMQTNFIVRSLEFSDLEALLELYGHLHAHDDPLPPYKIESLVELLDLITVKP